VKAHRIVPLLYGKGKQKTQRQAKPDCFIIKPKKRKITQSSKLLNFIFKHCEDLLQVFFWCNLEDVLEISTRKFTLSLGLLSLPNPSFSGIGKVRKFHEILLIEGNVFLLLRCQNALIFFRDSPTGYPPGITRGWGVKWSRFRLIKAHGLLGGFTIHTCNNPSP
jgi:hypothetical protein